MKCAGGYFVLFLLVMSGCTGKHFPDVSRVKVDLQEQRFEQDFFALDTIHIDQALQKLHGKYPGFLRDFIFNILALPPHPDSSKAVEQQIKSFIRSYKPLKDSSDKVFTETGDLVKEVRRGLQFVKYYFPNYKIPGKMITFIGPINSYGNILTSEALAVGLQLYMGNNYSLYQSEAGQALYPAYISRRFRKEYIPVNCMKTIVDDMFPDNHAGRPLIEQMIQAGKNLYLLDQLIPETADTLKTGYTQDQLDGCYKNEARIWTHFVQNDLLYISDPSIVKDYMNDAPKTEAFGEESPGFIGQFVGWQIVKKWMSKNENVTLPQLMQTNARTIFDQAKYKP
jgi:hypothetical protein